MRVHDTACVPVLSRERLISRLVVLADEIGIDRRDFVIFGSAPLLAHGLRQHVRDLDVVARGTAWRRASRHGLPATGTINGAPMALF